MGVSSPILKKYTIDVTHNSSHLFRNMKLQVSLLLSVICAGQAFTPLGGSLNREMPASASALSSSLLENDQVDSSQRRQALSLMVGGAMALPVSASAEESIFAPKFVQEYGDFQMTDEGWSFRYVFKTFITVVT